MEFAFTEDQRTITEAVREMLAESCETAALRKMLERGDAIDEGRWATIRDMGLIGMLAPESVGGLGLGMADLAPIAEAAGYVALPEPLIELAGIAIPLLAELDDDKGWLARAVAGEIVAVGHPSNPFVTDADLAGALLLADGEDIHLVAQEAVTVTREPSIDPFRRLFKVQWTPSPATLVGRNWTTTGDRGAVLAAAQMIGLGQRCIDASVAYARDRLQFGRPIGQNQAVKHLLANAQVAIEFARPVVLAAAAELPLGSLASRARAAHAKIAAADAADLAARNAVQVHGAMGITWEVDIHFFLKRALALKFAWGTSAQHLGTVMQRIISLPTGPDMTFASEIPA
jgi:alkylation response protein AidB-like acyl-CoA dehydrogenase